MGGRDNEEEAEMFDEQQKTGLEEEEMPEREISDNDGPLEVEDEEELEDPLDEFPPQDEDDDTYEALAAKKRSAPPRERPAKKLRQELEELPEGASFDEILEAMNYGTTRRRKSRKAKRRGRRKGPKNKANPEVTKKLGEATCLYANGRYEEAIRDLKEVIRLAPDLSEPYQLLGLAYDAMGDKQTSLDFYMLAAYLTPKDASLWKLLYTRLLEQGDKAKANYCLSKAITADPGDISLWFDRASLYLELREYQKAADSYAQISRICPDNTAALRTATQLYQECGQPEQAVAILEDNLQSQETGADLSVIDLLASILMERCAHAKALEHIEHAQQVYCSEKGMPLDLIIKAGICHAYLGQMEKAEAIFSVLQEENASTHSHLISTVADSLMTVEHYESALKFYLMLEGERDDNNVKAGLYLKIAKCYVALKRKLQAIEYFYKAINKLDDSVDARLTLSSLLLEEGRDDEAISVLSPPVESGSTDHQSSDKPTSWWLSGKIKLKLSQIYESKGLIEAFVNAIFPVIRETLFLETVQPKIKSRKRVSRSVLSERAKVLTDHQTDSVFHGFRPLASAVDRSKATRAKRLLQKKEAQKAAALDAGYDWNSDESDDESPQELREPPLPNLLKDEEHHRLIIDLCKSLTSLQRYWDALEIINLSLKLGSNTLSLERKEELRALGAQIEYNIADPARAWDSVRYLCLQHPCSFSAWNCYYKVISRSRLDSRSSKHNKFLHNMRTKHKDSIPPILISAHQLTMISQHQAAAREYLEAYKMMPDSPLINLCAGTALINLGLGHRLQNKHQAILQGLGFLYNNSQLCKNSQEAYYNLARAYHHVGLVSLAAAYYEKVFSIREKDHPIPKLPNENPDVPDNRGRRYCDLRREAAYNLHLIYKKSGAFDLARQVLKDHVAL